MTDDLSEKLDRILTELHDAREERHVQAVLAQADRVQISRLIVLLGRVLKAAGHTGEAVDRLEQTAMFVAEDLAASIVRADQADRSVAGAGADAALRSAGETAAQVAAAEEDTRE